MPVLYSFRNEELYCHHTLDEHPDPAGFTVHAHPVYEIYYFMRGEGRFLVEGKEYALSPGDFFVLRPAETHRLFISPDAPYERIAVHFPASLIEDEVMRDKLLESFRNRPLGVGNRYPAEKFPSLWRTFDHFLLRPGFERVQLVSRLMLFLTELYFMYNKGLPATGREGTFSSELIAYVNVHLYEEISLQSLADTFNRSMSQISRVFRQATGTSLWDYVLRKRVISAHAMLERGEKATEVCYACGFSDYSNFYRAYKAHFGYAPSRFQHFNEP
ncbi:MAG: AraC family transcriptional regulator [Lachnospiraceae bacterium]|nr:AraC family transcriptional regulator [Lachnospiraceae bacterium]MBP5254832.1 AraC family transcriptional regulator [Lachnospiraceae bacterium]